MDGGDHYLVRGETVHQQAYRCDVRDSVHGAHLMEVNLCHRNAVGMAFRLCDLLIDRHHIILDALRKL